MLVSFKAFTARCRALIPSLRSLFEATSEVFNFELFESNHRIYFFFLLFRTVIEPLFFWVSYNLWK